MPTKTWYCKCGTSISLRNVPPRVAELLKADHTGPGHGECDAKTAAKARAASERREALADDRMQPWER